MVNQLIRSTNRRMHRSGFSPVPVQVGKLPVSFATRTPEPQVVLSWVHALRSLVAPERTVHVLLHEQGHHVYWALSARMRRQAEGLFGVSTNKRFKGYVRYVLVRSTRGYVSPYAMVSADEDFAETFAYVMTDKGLTGDPVVDKKIAFVRRVISAKKRK